MGSLPDTYIVLAGAERVPLAWCSGQVTLSDAREVKDREGMAAHSGSSVGGVVCGGVLGSFLAYKVQHDGVELASGFRRTLHVYLLFGMY